MVFGYGIWQWQHLNFTHKITRMRRSPSRVHSLGNQWNSGARLIEQHSKVSVQKIHAKEFLEH